MRDLIVVACVCWLIPSTAAAQPFVSGGASAAWSAEGRNDSPYLVGPLGGWSRALQVGGGWMGERFGVSAESLLGPSIEGLQSTRTARQTTHHREYLFSGLLHVAVARGSRVSLETVAGATVGLGSFRYTNRTRLSFSGPVSSIEDSTDRREYFGPTVGCDLWIAPNKRIELGVTTRFNWLAHRSTDDDGVRTGLGSRVGSIGGNVRIKLGHQRAETR